MRRVIPIAETEIGINVKPHAVGSHLHHGVWLLIVVVLDLTGELVLVPRRRTNEIGNFARAIRSLGHRSEHGFVAIVLNPGNAVHSTNVQIVSRLVLFASHVENDVDCCPGYVHGPVAVGIFVGEPGSGKITGEMVLAGVPRVEIGRGATFHDLDGDGRHWQHAGDNAFDFIAIVFKTFGWWLFRFSQNPCKFTALFPFFQIILINRENIMTKPPCLKAGCGKLTKWHIFCKR